MHSKTQQFVKNLTVACDKVLHSQVILLENQMWVTNKFYAYLDSVKIIM